MEIILVSLCCNPSRLLSNWVSTPQNLSSGFPTKRDSNQSPQLQRLARKSISPVVSLDMVLSKTRITKTLISLRGCAGWSTSLLFANHRRQVFSRRSPINVHEIKAVAFLQAERTQNVNPVSWLIRCELIWIFPVFKNRIYPDKA